MAQHNRTLIGDPPTDRQAEMLAYIKGHIREHGLPPTTREIGLALGIRSPNGVMCHIKALIAKGCLKRHGRGLSRGWLPADADSDVCPCCGRPRADAD